MNVMGVACGIVITISQLFCMFKICCGSLQQLTVWALKSTSCIIVCRPSELVNNDLSSMHDIAVDDAEPSGRDSGTVALPREEVVDLASSADDLEEDGERTLKRTYVPPVGVTIIGDDEDLVQIGLQKVMRAPRCPSVLLGASRADTTSRWHRAQTHRTLLWLSC